MRHILLLMLARVLAFAVAALIAVTGVLPALDGSRCISMDRTMSPDESCPRCHASPPVSIGNPCCESVHVASLDARVSPPSHEPRIAPAPLSALLSPALPQLAASQTALRCLAMRPRGRPPGEQLDQLSSILRI